MGKEMASALVFVCLVAGGYAQNLVYPDQLDYMRYITRPFTISNPVAEYPTGPIQQAFSSASYPLDLTLGAAAPPRSTAVTQKPLQHWNDRVSNIIVRGVLKFALDIEREIYRAQGLSLEEQRANIVFSPINLAVTMAVVLAGSAGRTFDEVSRVLGLESGIDISRNSEIFHQAFGLMLKQFNNQIFGSTAPRTEFAVAVLLQNGFQMRPEFKTITNNVYENEVINVDFARDGRSTQNMVNSWVRRKTMDKITSILNDAPPPETKLILLSALYFGGEWNQHFLTGATKRKPFFIEENESINVDMMYNGGQFPFFENKQLGVKIVELPYKGHEISMYVVLPNAKGARALRNFQSQLTVDIIENLIQNMKNETCIIGMPRMKLSSSLSLRSTLANLGIRSLFDPVTADLSLIANGGADSTITTPSQLLPSVTTQTIRTRKDKPTSQPSQYSGNIMFPSRLNDEDDQTNENQQNHQIKDNYFTYQDKIHGYTVEQWSTGFSITRPRNSRDLKSKENTKNKDSYTVEGSKSEKAKIVNLESNKYKLNEQRPRRQSRPINQDFINFVKQQNLSSYGLDELRNSARLVNPGLYASDVLHKVEIEITEKGTEAAAVTAILLERDGNQKRLVANRPFLFFIRHNPLGLVMFWGTVNTPTPNYSHGT